MSACSPSDATNPGEDTVTDEISEIGTAVEVDPDDISLFGYGVRRNVDEDRCPEVDDGDRWIAERSAIMKGASQTSVIDALVSHYRGLGAELHLYKSTASESRILYVLDRDRKIHLEAVLDANGRASVFVKHSPCGVENDGTEPNGPFEPEALPT
ncbi:hypothetical protein [Iamia sp.]|uniref:hypothetical protein n=1 Tax=Iamia sp. TaxID=2722710 RepID=UPI002CBB431C|nr:hypothetical protein [Iamia sp.]HXH57040.1 hypothetical protein [Iamia sp.]